MPQDHSAEPPSGPAARPLSDLGHALTILSVAGGSFIIFAFAAMKAAIGAACDRASSNYPPDFAVCVPNGGDYTSAAVGVTVAVGACVATSYWSRSRGWILAAGLALALLSLPPVQRGGGRQAIAFLILLMAVILSVNLAGALSWVPGLGKPKNRPPWREPLFLLRGTAKLYLFGPFAVGLGVSVYTAFWLHPHPRELWVEPYGKLTVLRADEKGFLVMGFSEPIKVIADIHKKLDRENVDWIPAGSVTSLSDDKPKLPQPPKANAK